MNYTKLISKKKEYKYSVNICFDMRNEDRLASFIPNITTTEILREYLGSIIRGNTNIHSRILYGSYGTGKSHLLTVFSAILAHINTNGNGFENFSNLISRYDRELAEDIKKYVKDEKPYMVVPVYSDYSDFGKNITFSVKKELDRNGISVCFKGFYDEALELVEKWTTGKESAKKLEEECKKMQTTVDNLKKGLSTYDAQSEKTFNKVYAGMSYGAAFNSTSGNLIDNMNTANAAIKDQYRGIVLIFDEFGRYVEDYGEELKVKAIQDLAEYCDHSDYDNYLILVSHKQLSMYTEGMRKSVSDEWKKVEGRFKPTSINIKYDQCLSLIGHIIPKNTYWNTFKKKNEKDLNELYNQAWDFKGFMLPPETEEDNPFENGFPLHPITLFALDRLSKKVAQNERTFFTYLAGDEDNALYSQLQKYDINEFHFVGLDAIYDYFELNIKSFKTDDSYDSYKKLQYALSKLGYDEDGYQTRILKTIAAINIISATDDLVADKDTIISVVDGDKIIIARAVEELEKKKIIKYMRQYGYYDFFDSSIFDLEGMIEDKLLGISDEMVVSILNERFADFLLYPYRYNEKYFTNRAFVPAFAKKSDLTKKSFHNTLPKYYDGAAVFVLDDNADKLEYKQIEGIPERTLLVVNGNSKAVEAEVKRYIAVQYFYSKKDELAADDPSVVNELGLYLSEQESIVSDLIRRWKSLNNPGTFVVLNGEILDIQTENEVTNVLSGIMENAFSRTLMVNNDLLNKNNLTGAIKLARKKALLSVMEQKDIFSECGFLSPEFNILRSTLSKNGIVKQDEVTNETYRVADEDMNFFDDGTVAGLPVMTTVFNMLSKAESEKISLQDVYVKLKSEPFGLRDGYIPVVLAYALRKYQNVSLYFHGNEHSYTPEELIKALENPENYTLFICNWNDDEIAYIEALEHTFAMFLPKGDSLNRLEALLKAMNGHYASISKSARTTEIYVSDIAKKYRDIMSLTYKDFNGFFFTTLPKLNTNLQELAIQISNIKKELESVSEKQYIRVLRAIRHTFAISETDSLMFVLQGLYKTSWNKKSQKAFDYVTNNVLDLVSKASELTERQFVLELAKTITGFELAYWADNKIYDFEEMLKSAVNTLNEYNVETGLEQGETKITIESAGSEPIVSQFSQCDLSPIGQTMLNKINGTLNNFGESISYEEKVAIIASVLKKVVD